MTNKKKRKLDLRIVPAIAPSLVAFSVGLLVLGNHIGTLIIAVVVGYFSYLITNKFIDLLAHLQRNRR